MERTRSFEHFFFDGGGLIPPPERLRKVLVIGAGVAGVQTARQLLKLGAQVLVLEANDEVGGVWVRNYIGFGLQVPWRMYQFAEFPWPKDLQPSSEYPTGQEVQEYVRAYVREYNLRQYIRFNCKLLRLRFCAVSRQWDALYCDTFQEKFFKVTVDYAVICAGIYSQPYIPDYEGTDSYAGIQLHAKDFVDLSLARGRRVVIVGAGKTALDCVSSIVATNTATSVTLLYRQAHWPLPRRMLGTSVRKLLFNRAMTAMMPPFYTASVTGSTVTSKVTAPLRKLFWRSMESVISRKFRVTEQMRPRVHLPADLFYGGQILDNTMDKLVRSEALLTVKGEINRFVRNGVILQDGNFVAADLVLYCTGYLKTYDYLEGDMRSRLDLQKDGLYLYRNCLPYAVPHLAFIGSEVSTYNNILTHGLQALWLGNVLAGRVQLPPPAAMAEDVRSQQRWRRSIMPAQRSRGSVLMLYMMHYHDQLLADMGQAPHRKGFNLIAECFGAYTAKDYQHLLENDHTVLLETHGEEEQLEAAGVPPAVLAAAAAGRSGAVPGAAPAATGGGGGAATGSEHQGNGGAGGAAGGSGAGAGRGGPGAGALRAPGAANPLFDDGYVCSSSRDGTSASARSCNGQEGQGDLGRGRGGGSAAGSGTAVYGMSLHGGGAAAAEMAVAAQGRVCSPQNSVGAVSSGRAVRGEPDSMDSARAIGRPVSPRGATPAASSAAADGSGGAAPVWARTKQHRHSARAIGMRVSADMASTSAGIRWNGGADTDGGGGGSASAGAADRRPATTSSLGSSSANASAPKARVRRAPRADASDPLRSPPSGPPLPQQLFFASMSLPTPVGTAAAANYLASTTTTGPQASGADDVGEAAAAAAAAAGRRRSFTMGAAGGGAAAGAGAGPTGYAAPSSPSRLSRYTGPTSPIPCQSSISPRGPQPGTPDALPCGSQHVAGTSYHPHQQQQHQHVRWGLLSNGEAAEVTTSGGSASGGVGAVQLYGSRSFQPRSRGSIRSAPDNTATNTAAGSGGDGVGSGGSFPREGSSGGGGSGDDWNSPTSNLPYHCHQSHLPAAASPLGSHREAPPALVLPLHAAGPMGRSPHAVTSPRRAQVAPGPPSGEGECRSYIRCGGSDGGAQASCRHVGGGFAAGPLEHDGVGGEDVGAAAAAARQGFASAVGRVTAGAKVAPAAASRRLMDGGGGGGTPPFADMPGDITRSNNNYDINTNNTHINTNTDINSCVPIASSSDRSHRLSFGSRSTGSNASSCTTNSGPSGTDLGVEANGNSSGAAAPSASAIEAYYPITEDDDRSAIVVDGESPPLPPTPALQQPAAASPVWHGTASDVRLPVGSSVGGGASEGVFGSPGGSSAASLSLWQLAAGAISRSNSAASAHLGRMVHGGGAPRGGGGGGAGAGEARIATMERLEEVELGDVASEQEAQEGAAARVATEVGEQSIPAGAGATAKPAAAGGGVKGAAATAATSVAASPFAAGAYGEALPRIGSSVRKSPRRGSTVGGAFHVVGGAALEWRRLGSLGRNTDGMTAATLAEVGGGATAASSVAAGSWHNFPGASSTGMCSTGSSGGHLYSSISLAGGIAIGGVGVGQAPELVTRLPSRLSNGPTADSITANVLDGCVANGEPEAAAAAADNGAAAAAGPRRALAAPLPLMDVAFASLADTSPFSPPKEYCC